MLARMIMALMTFFAGTAPAFADSVQTAHRFSFTSIEGEHLPLSRFEGKVLLVVNTASRCGFTKQYADLQEVWERFRERGLVVLGVPSNDFGSQEPGTEKEIKSFCEVNFNVDFPMTSKVQVKGGDAHPFYVWAGGEVGALGTPRWNFHKYLIASAGRLVQWFSTPTNPTSSKVIGAIESLLAERAPSES
jgi:glutathione peroxidase